MNRTKVSHTACPSGGRSEKLDVGKLIDSKALKPKPTSMPESTNCHMVAPALQSTNTRSMNVQGLNKQAPGWTMQALHTASVCLCKLAQLGQRYQCQTNRSMYGCLDYSCNLEALFRTGLALPIFDLSGQTKPRTNPLLFGKCGKQDLPDILLALCVRTHHAGSGDCCGSARTR
jgi:hypothetical protein